MAAPNVRIDARYNNGVCKAEFAVTHEAHGEVVREVFGEMAL